MDTPTTGNSTVDSVITSVEAAAPIIIGALSIVSPAVATVLTGILSSIPAIITAVENDISAFQGGALTEAQLQTKWTAMQVSFQSAVAAWNAIPDEVS